MDTPHLSQYELTSTGLILQEAAALTTPNNTVGLKSADVRQIVEDQLARMLAQNPLRMDYYRKYSEIVANYNREKDRVTIEETFAKLLDLANSLSAEQRRAAEEGLSEEELALFDLLQRKDLSKTDRERVKRESRNLLVRLREVIERVDRWTNKLRPKSKA